MACSIPYLTDVIFGCSVPPIPPIPAEQGLQFLSRVHYKIVFPVLSQPQQYRNMSGLNRLKTVIITGANKGIGYGIAETLAQKEGWNIVMACRDLGLGQKAQREIEAKAHSGTRVSVEQLDIRHEPSIKEFVHRVATKWEDIDVVINNAGIAERNDTDVDAYDRIFATNFYGTVSFSDHVLEYVRDKGKFIFVGASLAKLAILGAELQARFRDPQLDRHKLMGLMAEYRRSLEEKSQAAKGWPHKNMSIYMVSKLGINQFVKVFSKQEQIVKRSIQVYGLCPGFVKTDMSKQGPLTVQQGAVTPVYLAELPFAHDPELHGKFFSKCKVLSVD